MIYGKVHGVDKPVSRIVFGTATKKMFDAFRSVYGEADDFDQRLKAAFGLLDTMYALGVNCFDASDHYGEEPLGEWLEARGLHEKVVVLTKGAHHNRFRPRVNDFDILHDAHNSLAKLKTRRIDIYMLHRDEPEKPVGPIMEALNRLYGEGKISVFGASNWTAERMEEANEYAAKRGLEPFRAGSPYFGLAEQVEDPWGGGCVSIAGPGNARARAWYEKNRVPVFAYSTLARGFFSGRVSSDHPERAGAEMDEAGVKGYCHPVNFERLRRAERLSQEKNVTVAQIAMAWIFSQSELDVYALTTPSTGERMRESIGALSIRLTAKEVQWLNLGNH